MSVIDNAHHAVEKLGRHILKAVDEQVREHEHDILKLLENERKGRIDNSELEHRLETEVPALVWRIIREENEKVDKAG